MKGFLKNQFKLTFIVVVIIINFSLLHSKIPLIAVYSNNYPAEDTNPVKSEVGETYVNWIIASGGEVVVLHPWDSESYINFVLAEVDGALFQGGHVDIDQKSEFAKTAKYILASIIELHLKQKKSITLWGTCLGFEMINNLIEGKNVLSKVDASEQIVSAKFSETELRTTQMYKFFTAREFEYMGSLNTLNENHIEAISLDAYSNSKYLKGFFKVTSTAFDKNGVEYINSIEAFDYPIFATQHHPEKTIFDINPTDAAASSIQSLMISRALGNSFIYLASQNNKSSELEKTIVYNYLNDFWKISISNKTNFDLRKIDPPTMKPELIDGVNLYYMFNKDTKEIVN